MIKKELLQLNVADLVPYENNPRVITQRAIDACAESIKQCESLDPIEVDENNVILSGHTRRLAMMQLGIETADVVRYTGLTEEQKKKYRLLANKTGELSLWDFGKLDEELAEMDFDGFDFGFLTKSEQDEQTNDESSERKEVAWNDIISVIIECENEQKAQQTFDDLTAEGYECRISTL